MTKEEIEAFITKIDEASKNFCVFPDKQSFDCCDCYLCRVDFFNFIREELEKGNLIIVSCKI